MRASQTQTSPDDVSLRRPPRRVVVPLPRPRRQAEPGFGALRLPAKLGVGEDGEEPSEQPAPRGAAAAADGSRDRAGRTPALERVG